MEDVKDGSYAAQGAAYAAKDKINVEKWAKNPLRLKFQRTKWQIWKIAGEPLWNDWVKENEGKIPAQELLDIV